MKMKAKRKVYWILSGEGERGTWKRKVATERGIRSILGRERCGGERFARAVCDFYETKDGEICGVDAEDGMPVTVTQEAANDVEIV